MHATTRRYGALMLCTLALGPAGCASMSAPQRSGAAIGAAAGALLGGSTGWAVQQYQVRQVKRAAPGDAELVGSGQIMARIDDLLVTPARLSAGEPVTVRAQYTVHVSSDRATARIRQTGTILFNGGRLTELPPHELQIARGTTEVQNSLLVPHDAAPGSYTLLTRIELMPASGTPASERTAGFTVAEKNRSSLLGWPGSARAGTRLP